MTAQITPDADESDAADPASASDGDGVGAAGRGDSPGTSTGVGKTVVTAAWAALAHAAGQRVAVVKVAQSGTDDGDSDVAEIRRLTALPAESVVELAAFPEPLAPATAARRAGLPAVDLGKAADTIRALAAEHDLVLVEGAGGLLVELNDTHPRLRTVADLASELGAPVLTVAAAGLGTLNHTALTLAALASRGLTPWGVVIGSWPGHPDLAARCNLEDLPRVACMPLEGALPEGAAAASPADFLALARAGLAPRFGGSWDAADFTRIHAPEPKAPE